MADSAAWLAEERAAQSSAAHNTESSTCEISYGEESFEIVSEKRAQSETSRASVSAGRGAFPMDNIGPITFEIALTRVVVRRLADLSNERPWQKRAARTCEGLIGMKTAEPMSRAAENGEAPADEEASEDKRPMIASKDSFLTQENSTSPPFTSTALAKCICHVVSAGKGLTLTRKGLSTIFWREKKKKI